MRKLTKAAILFCGELWCGRQISEPGEPGTLEQVFKMPTPSSHPGAVPKVKVMWGKGQWKEVPGMRVELWLECLHKTQDDI